MFLSRGDRDLGVAFQTHPGRQAFISSGSKEPSERMILSSTNASKYCVVRHPFWGNPQTEHSRLNRMPVWLALDNRILGEIIGKNYIFKKFRENSEFPNFLWQARPSKKTTFGCKGAPLKPHHDLLDGWHFWTESGLRYSLVRSVAQGIVSRASCKATCPKHQS